MPRRPLLQVPHERVETELRVQKTVSVDAGTDFCPTSLYYLLQAQNPELD